MVFGSRRRPFAADGRPLSTGSDAEAKRLWRQRVAEAARLAAEDLADEDEPQLRRLHVGLKDLEARITAGRNEPIDADDLRLDGH
jgi:hypothetical protein